MATAGSEFEANLMFDIIHSNGFWVEKPPSEPVSSGEVKTWNVVIDEGWFGEDEAATAIQVLRDYGLPRPPEPEIKSTDSFGLTSERSTNWTSTRKFPKNFLKPWGKFCAGFIL